MRHLLLIAGLTLATASAAFAQTPNADPFPPGDGPDTLAVASTQCHAPTPIGTMRMGEAGWRRQVEIMILRGAQIGPDDIDRTATYLATVFGPGVPLPGPVKEVHLAAGSGAELVQTHCSLCHSLERVVIRHRPGQQWAAIVHRMMQFGAPVDGTEADQIVAYLEEHYAAQ